MPNPGASAETPLASSQAPPGGPEPQYSSRSRGQSSSFGVSPFWTAALRANTKSGSPMAAVPAQVSNNVSAVTRVALPMDTKDRRCQPRTGPVTWLQLSFGRSARLVNDDCADIFMAATSGASAVAAMMGPTVAMPAGAPAPPAKMGPYPRTHNPAFVPWTIAASGAACCCCCGDGGPAAVPVPGAAPAPGGEAFAEPAFAAARIAPMSFFAWPYSQSCADLVHSPRRWAKQGCCFLAAEAAPADPLPAAPPGAPAPALDLPPPFGLGQSRA